VEVDVWLLVNEVTFVLFQPAMMSVLLKPVSVVFDRKGRKREARTHWNGAPVSSVPNLKT
jgi:hypothetical protein